MDRLTRHSGIRLRAREVVAMDPFLIGIALIVLLLAWAGWKLRGRDNSMGPEARGDRDRRTGGFDGSNG
jgi:hypothetical protein